MTWRVMDHSNDNAWRVLDDRQLGDKEIKTMANSYGFDGSIPEWAAYGIYDTENGEWTGQFFSSQEEAQNVADTLEDDSPLVVASTTDEEDYL